MLKQVVAVVQSVFGQKAGVAIVEGEQAIQLVTGRLSVLGTVDKGAQLLRLHPSLFEVGKRGQEDLGKPRLRGERGEVIMRLGLAQELFHNQGCSQRGE